MPPSPLCLVADGGGPFNPTLNGLNITPGDTVSVQLESPAGVASWYLQCGLTIGTPPVVVPGSGTDELGTPPTLVGVNATTGLVTDGPTTTVTFTFPASTGRALLFSSTVTGTFGQITTTFALFSPTGGGYRVGPSGLTKEGSNSFGWASIVNPAIRNIGSGGGVATVAGVSPVVITGTSTNPIVNLQLPSQTQGDILYFNGTNWVRLPAGTSGEFLETLGPGFNPVWAPAAGGGFSDNSSAQRTRQEPWLRRNEYTSSGEGGTGQIFLSSLSGIVTPLKDGIPGGKTGVGIAVLGDKVYFVGKDNSGNTGALYGVDLFGRTGLSANPTGPIHRYQSPGSVYDAPTDFFGIRAMNSTETTTDDYLFGIFPDASFVHLGIVGGAAPYPTYLTTYNVATPTVPVRACFYGSTITAFSNTLTFFFSGSDGNIYSVTGTGGTITNVYTTGDAPGAMFVSDAGDLWVVYTTSGTLARFSVTFTGPVPTLVLLNTYSTTGPWGSSLTAMVDMISDGRFAWILDSAAYTSGGIAGFDLQSGALVKGFQTPAIVVGGNINRLVWDGTALYYTSGNSGNSIWRVHPETGAALFAASTGVDAVSRGVVVDDSGTIIVANYFSAAGMNLTLAGGTFENRSFNSIRYLGRPLQFIYGGAQQGQATVAQIASPPNVFATPFTFTPSLMTALCRTSTGTTAVSTMGGTSGGPQWVLTVIDIEGQAATNNITVTGVGGNIEDPNNPGTFASSVTLNKNWQAVTWIWVNEFTEWKVLSISFTVGGGGGPAVPDEASTNAAPVVIGMGTNPGTIVTSVTITPEYTGQLNVTGLVVAETTSPSGDTAYLVISQGASPVAGDYFGEGVTVAGSTGNESQLAILIQYGTSFDVSLPAFTVGSPVIINLAVGSAAGNITIPALGAQLNVREIGMSVVVGGGITIDNQGTPIAGNPHTTLNFTGAGVTASDAGGGVSNITIPGSSGITVENQGSGIAGNPHTTLNFTGAGVVASNAGGGVSNITISGGGSGITVESGGTPIANNPHTTLNFTTGLASVDAGGGVATVTAAAGTGTLANHTYLSGHLGFSNTQTFDGSPAYTPLTSGWLQIVVESAWDGFTSPFPPTAGTSAIFSIRINGTGTFAQTYATCGQSPNFYVSGHCSLILSCAAGVPITIGADLNSTSGEYEGAFQITVVELQTH